jgi:hypothetical protein
MLPAPPHTLLSCVVVARRYNLARLKLYVMDHGFDVRGNAKMHLLCMMAILKVGRDFMTACHARAVQRANAPTEQISKSEVRLYDAL